MKITNKPVKPELNYKEVKELNTLLQNWFLFLEEVNKALISTRGNVIPTTGQITQWNWAYFLANSFLNQSVMYQASPTFAGLTLSDMSTAGVVHNAATTGLLSSSKIVNADIDASALIVLSKLATQADQTVVGNVSGGAAVPIALSVAQIKTMCGYYTSGDSPNFVTVTATYFIPTTAYKAVDGTVGLVGETTVALAKLTPVTGSDGSLTFKDGILTAYTPPT